MKFLPYSPAQIELLPPRVREVLGEGHLCFFLRRVVERLDLGALEQAYSEEGQPGYHPALLVSVWLYAYALGITSARRLEQRIREDLAFRYLAGGAQPDFWTLNAFRRRHPKALNDLFTPALELARAAGLGRLGHVAIDSTRIAANASPNRTETAEQVLQIDVRVIAATNRDLLKDVQDGRFREDLYYRLNVVKVRLPPLRERKEDLALLADHFLKRLGSKKRMSREALEMLARHDWPGNVRELANVIEVSAVLSSDREIGADDLPLKQASSSQKTKTLAELEKEHISRTLVACAGNKTKAAKLLGISLRNLYRKIDRYGLP